MAHMSRARMCLCVMMRIFSPGYRAVISFVASRMRRCADSIVSEPPGIGICDGSFNQRAYELCNKSSKRRPSHAP